MLFLISYQSFFKVSTHVRWLWRPAAVMTQHIYTIFIETVKDNEIGVYYKYLAVVKTRTAVKCQSHKVINYMFSLWFLVT